MTLLDVNLLLYVYFPTYSQHQAAFQWMSELLRKEASVGLSWIGILAFLRLSTNGRVMASPTSLKVAMSRIDGLLQLPQVEILHPTYRHWRVLENLLSAGRSGGNLTSDAHLAALAIEHGATLATADSDFARFPGLRYFNPLEQQP